MNLPTRVGHIAPLDGEEKFFLLVSQGTHIPMGPVGCFLFSHTVNLKYHKNRQFWSTCLNYVFFIGRHMCTLWLDICETRPWRYQMSAHSLLGSTDIWAGGEVKIRKGNKKGDLREQNHQKPNGTIAKAWGVIEFKALLTLYLFFLK